MGEMSMRASVNRKAVVILLLGIAALGIGTHLLHGYQVQRNARGLFEDALQLERQGEDVQAVRELELYLGLVPSDTDALAKYSLLLVKLAKTRRERMRTYLVLDSVLRRDGDRHDVRREAAKLAISIKLFKEAKEHLLVLMKNQRKDEDADLMHMRGRCEVGVRDFEAARDWYARAAQRAPNNVEVAEGYALLLRVRLDAADEADQVIEQLVRANERLLAARLAAAKYYRRIGGPEHLAKAAKHVAFALNELAAQDAELFLVAADVARAQKKKDDARKYLEQALGLFPKDYRLSHELARLAIEDGQPARAKGYLEQSLQYLPDEPDALWKVANLLIDAGELVEARNVIGQLADKNATTLVGFLHARLAARDGDWAKARLTLEKIKKMPSPELDKHVHVLLAECYGRLGSPEQQLAAYTHALKSDVAPQLEVPARRGLAKCLVSLGKLDKALDEYRKILPRAPELTLEAAGLLIAHNLRLPAENRRWDKVEELLKSAPEARQKTFEKKLLDAVVLLARQKRSEARALMEQERKLDPKQPGPWLFLVDVAETEGKAADVLSLLDEAEKAAGRRVEFYVARTRHWTRSGSADALKQFPAIEAALDQFPDADADRLRVTLAGAYAARGEVTAALRLWRQLADHQPANLDVRLRLLEGALRDGNDAEAGNLISQLERIEGGGGAWTAYARAARIIAGARKADDEQQVKEAVAKARGYLAKAAVLRPSWARIPLLEAETYELDKRKDKALEKYQAALERGERRLEVVKRVCQLLYGEGRFAEADALLNKLPEELVDSIPELGRLAAQVTLLKSGKTDEDAKVSRQQAFKRAQKSVAADTMDHRVYLWLGQMALIAEQPAEADKAFRKARALNDQVPETWVPLILLLARTDVKKAEAEMAEARRKLPKNLLAVAMAPCEEALGRLEQAEKEYRAALDARADAASIRQLAAFYTRTGQRAKAEPILRTLLERSTKAPEATQAWGRRSLALLLALGGNYQRFKEARELLDKNGTETEAAPEDRIARALVLATRPENRRGAIQMLENIPGGQGSLPADMQFLLGQLYEADGNWTQAHTHFLILLQAHEKNPVYLAHYARGLLREKKAKAAVVWVDKLEKVAPAALATLELRTRVLKDTGETATAARLVQQYAEKKDARLDAAAALLEQLDQTSAAEKLYRAFVAGSKEPESVLVLAGFLARHKKLAEALDLCEQAWKKGRPEAVAMACLTVLRSGQPSNEQRERVGLWLDKASEQKPTSMVLLACLAEIEDLRGRYDKAMTIYRNMLRREKNNVMALNNLAYLMALIDSDKKAALALIQTAIDVAGPHAELLDSRATVYLSDKKAQLAIPDLQQAVAQAPVRTRYFHLAQAYHATGNRADAGDALHKASELGLQDSDLHALERVAFKKLTDELP